MYNYLDIKYSQSVKASQLKVKDALEGTYLGSKPAKYNKLHQLSTRDCIVTIVSTVVLDRMMCNVQVGEDIIIKTISQKISKSKHPYNIFKVERMYSPIETLLEEVSWANALLHEDMSFRVQSNGFAITCLECKGKDSMSLYRDSNRYFCHKCDAKGDLINWMELLHPGEGITKARLIKTK